MELCHEQYSVKGEGKRQGQSCEFTKRVEGMGGKFLLVVIM